MENSNLKLQVAFWIAMRQGIGDIRDTANENHVSGIIHECLVNELEPISERLAIFQKIAQGLKLAGFGILVSLKEGLPNAATAIPEYIRSV